MFLIGTRMKAKSTMMEAKEPNLKIINHRKEGLFQNRPILSRVPLTKNTYSKQNEQANEITLNIQIKQGKTHNICLKLQQNIVEHVTSHTGGGMGVNCVVKKT